MLPNPASTFYSCEPQLSIMLLCITFAAEVAEESKQPFFSPFLPRPPFFVATFLNNTDIKSKEFHLNKIPD